MQQQLTMATASIFFARSKSTHRDLCNKIMLRKQHWENPLRNPNSKNMRFRTPIIEQPPDPSKKRAFLRSREPFLRQRNIAIINPRHQYYPFITLAIQHGDSQISIPTQETSIITVEETQNDQSTRRNQYKDNREVRRQEDIWFKSALFWNVVLTQIMLS